jgi:hypothetical protein
MNTHALFTRHTAAIAALAICSASQAIVAAEIEAPAALGAIGITPGETARFSAVLLPPAVQSESAAPCVVEMRIVDTLSKTLAVLQKVLLRPGQVVSLDLPGNQAYMWQPMRGNRAQIRAEIRSIDAGGSCPVAQTLEVFDTNSGKTSAVLQSGR